MSRHGRANPARQEFLHHTLSEDMGFVATGFGGGDFGVHTGEDGDDGGGLEQQRAEAAGGVMDGLGSVFGLHHVPEGAAVGHLRQGVGIALGFVRHVLDEEQGQHVVPVLGGVHVSAQFITAFPEGGMAFGFLEGHGVEAYLR